MSKFKVGDRVRDLARTYDGDGTGLGEGRVVDVGVQYIRVRFDDHEEYLGEFDAHTRAVNELELVEEESRTISVIGRSLHSEVCRAQDEQALRYNSDKPESDYIFTYQAGVDAVFDQDFNYYETLHALGDLYRADGELAVYDAAQDVLNALREDAEAAGDDIVALLAETQAIGAKKYAPGNYLLGCNWRQHFQCAVRHAQAIQAGDEYDYDAKAVALGAPKGFPHRGNFFFNVIRAANDLPRGIGTDDRIRAPKAKAAAKPTILSTPTGSEDWTLPHGWRKHPCTATPGTNQYLIHDSGARVWKRGQEWGWSSPAGEQGFRNESKPTREAAMAAALKGEKP